MIIAYWLGKNSLGSTSYTWFKFIFQPVNSHKIRGCWSRQAWRCQRWVRPARREATVTWSTWGRPWENTLQRSDTVHGYRVLRISLAEVKHVFRDEHLEHKVLETNMVKRSKRFLLLGSHPLSIPHWTKFSPDKSPLYWDDHGSHLRCQILRSVLHASFCWMLLFPNWTVCEQKHPWT